MGKCLLYAICFMGAVVCAAKADAEIHYHFFPLLNGQTPGVSQFAEVSPVSGPQDFRVTISGAMVGSTPSADPQSAQVYLDKWGLGVWNPQVGKDTGVHGQVELDGKNGGEYLRLEFDVPVQLTYLTFASVGLSDKFGLWADGQQVDLQALFPGQSTIRSIALSQGNWPGHVDLTQAAQSLGYAQVWDIVAADPSFGSGFQLENLGVVPIPEPSTLLLWCLGCLAVASVRFRRRSSR
jgi:hypothetical protein